MSLKLFRSTGYASMFEPGETRAATHPGWVVVLALTWVALACNVALWRELPFVTVPEHRPQLVFALGLSLLMAALTGALLGTLAWWRTLRLFTLVLLVAWAVLAAQAWRHGIPLGPGQSLPSASALAALLGQGWLDVRMWAVLLVLAGVPLFVSGRITIKRLPLGRQLRFNVLLFGISLGVAYVCVRWLYPAVNWLPG